MFTRSKPKEPIIFKAQRDLIDVLNQAIGKKVEIKATDLEFPPDPQLGDFAFPCFRLSQRFKKSPLEIAEKLAELINYQLEAIRRKTLVETVQAKGAYLNFTLKKEKFTHLVLKRVAEQKEKYGRLTLGQSEKIMIEYISPNTNKPLHLGHLRNAALGQALANILEEAGFKVTRTCLVNDRGVHISKSMLAYQKFGKGETPRSSGLKGDHLVGKYYVTFEQKVKEDPSLQKKIQELLQKWEARDRLTLALWKKMTKWVLEGFKTTYQKLGVKFDKVYFESKIYQKGRELVLAELKKGIFKKDKTGAVVAPLEEFGLPNKVLLRADGTTVYITQDIYLAQKKFQDFKTSKSVYVVGSEQNLHFKELFKILELLGWSWAKDYYHLSYGMVYLPEGRMKSREGTVVDADDLVSELEAMARQEIKKRYPTLAQKELERRSSIIALGALKYFLLEPSPERDMNFDPKKSLSFTGRTGPYLQYTYARILSILKKSKTHLGAKVDYTKLATPKEHNLVMLLARFPQVVEQVALNYDPSELTRFLYTLAKEFSGFYRDHHVLEAPDQATSRARLLLIEAVRIVLRKGLNLLGIEALERM